jgi:hypothetical protein
MAVQVKSQLARRPPIVLLLVRVPPCGCQQEEFSLSDDLTVARPRARKRAGESVWNNFAESARSDAIDDEFRAMDDERAATAGRATIPPIES